MKTLYRLLFSVLFFVIFTAIVFADDNPSVTSSGVYFGVRGSRMEWKAGDSKFFGYLVGPSAGIDYRKPMHVYGGYRFYWVYGNTKSGNCSRHLSNMDMQIRLGYTYGRTLLFTPYAGLGVNAIQRKKSGHQLPCTRLSYTSVYVPVGAMLSYHPSSQFSIGVDYQYTPQVDSSTRISKFHNISFDLKKQGEHSVEFPIQFCFPKPRFHNVQYRFIPFYRTYFYGSSTLSCACTCQTNPTINLHRQRAYEWGIRYEIAIW